MPKNDFISDKLIDISDRFKRDYAERNHLPPPEESAKREEKPLPLRDVQRDARELAERITRDRAMAARQLEELSLRQGELQRFDELAQKVLERASSAASADELAKLRIEYFGAAGRISVVAPAAPVAADGGEPLSRQEIFRLVFLVAASILLAALLLAGTLIALLG